MRGADHVRQVKEHVVFGGLFGEDVESGARDVTGFQQLGQRVLIDKTTRAQLMIRTPFLVFSRFLSRGCCGSNPSAARAG